MKPYPPRPGETRHEKSVSAEKFVPKSRDHGDIELHTFFEHTDMTGMNVDLLARSQIVRDDLSTQRTPEPAGARKLL